MQTNPFSLRSAAHRLGAIAFATALTGAMSGCGGGSETTAESQQTLVASAISQYVVDLPVLPDTDAMFTVRPLFKLSPTEPAEPVGPEAETGLLDQVLTPAGTTTVATTYTPAQIRAAYGFPALPASMAGLSPAQAAQLGAGQTIYIVDAMHNPNAAAELAAFNARFGLPTCTTVNIPVTAALPLAAAPTNGCTFSVVYNTASGTLTGTAPAYDAGWATEISLDVQWAHATAPLARIVLIEAASSGGNDLMGAIQLANRMGPGAVSMSFGGLEGSWTASVDTIFTGANMTYLAATGDNGVGVSWPAVSPRVLAVGGTTLTYSGSGSRVEATWSGTGGGTSIYTPAPAYQTANVPGMGSTAFRRVSDVSFNADPATGQYVAVIPPGTSAAQWKSVGGTSLSTPQWAGLVAIGNATRALSGKSALSAPHTILYGQVATAPTSYASAFLDITTGADGSCATCAAKTGFDNPTGLGTPNVSNLVSLLSGASIAPVAPVVTPASIAGVVGSPLTFTVSATGTNAMTYSLAGAPAGMTIGATGVVTWSAPVAGTYNVTVSAKDSKTALSGSAVYTISIAKPTAPAGTGGTINGTAGKALNFSAVFTAANPLTYTLGGAPAGMSINTAGAVSWASPAVGTYTVTVTAKDSKTGLSGSAVYTVKIASATTSAGLTITAPAMAGKVGSALSGTIVITDPGATQFMISISGAPLGMGFTISGSNIVATWANPVAGNYTLVLSVQDNRGQTATAKVPVTITAK